MSDSRPVPPVDLDDRVGPVVVEPTGDADVDAVVAELAALDGTPVVDHVAVLESVHAGLRRVLDGTTAG
ncbi:hypothetical protein INN71_14400 [Nocardioides sp. ChNu-153]|uniref:hypothetical protein n=1 Tax=unclassified Nocardioides TaxID=2615069 RepID=UPI002406FD78|nr:MULTISPECIES: hypothetical protein [unclassified Nocardioides]MDF9715209.1 hypothetical protein [Nocardioides sp. ChNu-99]MDN7122580.1 hypothetical protein [Nocardioides sp. ChNu-153]